jgi:hypothetical protein
MSEDYLKAYLESVNVDAIIQEKLKGVADSSAVVAVAQAAESVFSV